MHGVEPESVAKNRVLTMTDSLNYYRYSRLVMVVPVRYMARAFIWIHDGDSQRVYEFFDDNPDLLKHFDHTERQKIREGTDPENMDLSLLYKLLLHATDIPTDNPKWGSPILMGQLPSLGQVLFQLKKIRNENSHKDPKEQTSVSDDDLDSLATTQEYLLTQLLILAGQWAGMSNQTIRKWVSRVKTDVATERDYEEDIVERYVSLSRLKCLSSKRGQRLVIMTEDASIGTYVRLSHLYGRTFKVIKDDKDEYSDENDNDNENEYNDEYEDQFGDENETDDEGNEYDDENEDEDDDEDHDDDDDDDNDDDEYNF